MLTFYFLTRIYLSYLFNYRTINGNIVGIQNSWKSANTLKTEILNSSEQLSNEESLNQSVEQLVSNRHSELKCQLNKNNDDGIILKEEKQNENVSILTWFKLLNYGIGITGVAIIILLAWIWGSSNILISYFIGIWLKESQSDSNNRMYFTLFFNLIIIWFLSSVLLVATTYGVLLISSFKLHKKMIWKVIRAPSIFFDENPIGRIITRFSRDISILDYMIGFSLNIFSNGFIKVFGVLIFIWINFPYMLISLSIVALFMYLVQRRCYLAQNESQRIDAITKAPINTKILSAIDGLNTIRAFHKEKHFTVFNLSSPFPLSSPLWIKKNLGLRKISTKIFYIK